MHIFFIISKILHFLVQAALLTRFLTHSHLPGLSSLDQMHLLALADTVASFNTAVADRFGSEPGMYNLY